MRVGEKRGKRRNQGQAPPRLDKKPSALGAAYTESRRDMGLSPPALVLLPRVAPGTHGALAAYRDTDQGPPVVLFTLEALGQGMTVLYMYCCTTFRDSSEPRRGSRASRKRVEGRENEREREWKWEEEGESVGRGGNGGGGGGLTSFRLLPPSMSILEPTDEWRFFAGSPSPAPLTSPLKPRGPRNPKIGLRSPLGPSLTILFPSHRPCNKSALQLSRSLRLRGRCWPRGVRVPI